MESKKNITSLFKPSSTYTEEDGKYVFTPFDEEIVSDFMDKIKTVFKNFVFLYEMLIYVIAPQWPSRYFFIRRLKKEIKNQDLVVINLGSGYTNLGEDIINVDLIPYKPVEVVCDITELPFKDNSIDYILNIAVLEHVPEPQKVISEMHRILKPGGKILVEIPFMQGFHASPYDFNRFTSEGMKFQFRDFNITKLHANSPTGGMLWQLQEWVALLFSFGIKPLHTFILLFLMTITFPIKILDVVLQYHPLAKNIASAFIIEAEKK